ncbi:hypothetical protein D3C85_1118550 [compost metagenome]
MDPHRGERREGELGGRNIVDADQLNLLGNRQPPLVDGPQHPNGDGVGGDEQRLGPVPCQHLFCQSVAGGAGEVPAIEIALLHHPQPLTVVEEGQFTEIRRLILTPYIADAAMPLGDEEVHHLLADERQIHVHGVKFPLGAAIHEHQLGRERMERSQPLLGQMADNQDAVDGGELTPLGAVVEMGQLYVEAGALGLDAVANGEIVGVIDLGALRVGIDRQKVQLALVHPLAGATGLVLQPLGNLEDLLPGLFLDAQRRIFIEHPRHSGLGHPRLLCNFLQRGHAYSSGDDSRQYLTKSNGQAADSPAFLLKEAGLHRKNPKAKRPPEWEASSK